VKVSGDVITLPNGTMHHRSQLHGIMGEVLTAIADLSVDLQRSDIDMRSFSCMLILSVLNGKLSKLRKLPETLSSVSCPKL